MSDELQAAREGIDKLTHDPDEPEWSRHAQVLVVLSALCTAVENLEKWAPPPPRPPVKSW